MKQLFIVFACFTIMLNAKSQGEQYHIIRVKGKITNMSTGKQLSPGDKINASDQLQFMDMYSQAIVISKKTGKFTITMPDADVFGEEKLLAMAETAASPIQGRSQLITRAGNAQSVDDLQSLFGKESFYVIGDELDIKLNPDQYQLNDNQYIALEYNLDDEHLSKKLKSGQQNIYINKKTLLEESTSDTIQDVSVYQYDMNQRTIVKITEMNLIFIDQDTLLHEMNNVKTVLTELGKSRKEIINYMAQYFIDVYGKTDHAKLYAFLRKTVFPEKA